MTSSTFFRCVTGAIAAVAFVSLQVHCQREQQGVLEAVLDRAQDALRAAWGRARADADDVVQGVVRGFRRQEHDALHAASVQLEKLGVGVDLTEASDDVDDSVVGCAKETQAKYRRLLAQLRRRVERCWGWEAREVTALLRALENLMLAGDRLPGLLRTNMDQCLSRGRGGGAGGGGGRGGDNATTSVPPSPFRVVRCTVDAVNLTWTYVSSVPREVARTARKTAGLLGSSREDWDACARGVIRQTAGPALQYLRDLGACVADRVSEQSWRRMHRAWQNPRR
ncbi:Interference hedgehog [Frankliniella fusca]|uniref:Interference hedgehog n=1 Tax=Frankliniella fusca TaxID=407009 RepID=A0AAE1GS45_9NEOP|nr:Interference hedgehog [Frankliniella fusca]